MYSETNSGVVCVTRICIVVLAWSALCLRTQTFPSHLHAFHARNNKYTKRIKKRGRFFVGWESRLQESKGNTSANGEDTAESSKAAGASAVGDGRSRGPRRSGRMSSASAVASSANRASLANSGSGGNHGGGLGSTGGLSSGRAGSVSGARTIGGARSIGGRGLGAGLGSRGLGLGGSRGRRGAAAVAVGAAVTKLDLDALPAAAVVAVDVVLDALGGRGIGASIVDNGDALVVAEERSLREIGVATSPLDGALGSILAASNPSSELDLHGGLGKTSSATLGVGSGQGTDDVVVDQPGDTRRSPLNRVCVERSKRVGDGVESTTVEGSSVALAEVVGLSLGVVASNPLPVDLEVVTVSLHWLVLVKGGIFNDSYLVKIIGLENGRGDDTDTGGGLDNDIDAAEEDVLASANSGGLSLGADGESSAVAVVAESGAGKRIEATA